MPISILFYEQFDLNDVMATRDKVMMLTVPRSDHKAKETLRVRLIKVRK